MRQESTEKAIHAHTAAARAVTGEHGGGAATVVSGPPDDGFGGHEFEYERETDLFRCKECRVYEVSARAGNGPIASCAGLIGYGGDSDRVYLLVTENLVLPHSQATYLATRIRTSGIGRCPRFPWRNGRGSAIASTGELQDQSR